MSSDEKQQPVYEIKADPSHSWTQQDYGFHSPQRGDEHHKTDALYSPHTASWSVPEQGQRYEFHSEQDRLTASTLAFEEEARRRASFETVQYDWEHMPALWDLYLNGDLRWGDVKDRAFFYATHPFTQIGICVSGVGMFMKMVGASRANRRAGGFAKHVSQYWGLYRIGTTVLVAGTLFAHQVSTYSQVREDVRQVREERRRVRREKELADYSADRQRMKEIYEGMDAEE